MAYTKTVWVDRAAPFVNATNLNHIEQGIADAAVAAVTPCIISYNYTTSSYPNRSTATSDPNRRVYWEGPVAPTVSGTGSTGAVARDKWIRETIVP